MEVPPLRKLLYMRLGDLDNARQWFEKAADLVEKTGHEAGARWLQRARIWNALGTVARSDGRDPKALELFEKALNDDPDDRNARHNLALLSARRRDFSKADRLWRANISSDPNFLPSRVAYAESLASRKETSAAIEQYASIV